MIRAVIAEDHLLVREGICKLLEADGGFRIVGEADNGLDALEIVKRLVPDVLVLDLAMPGMNGLETLAQVRTLKPGPRVVILSMYSDLGTVKQALEFGALGYVLKQSVADELLAAIHAVHSGSGYLSSGVSQVLAAGFFGEQPRTLLDRLSPREREVVKRVVQGASTREIAESLHTSVKTVEKQRRDAMRKLEVDNLASLVRVSLELGLVANRQPVNSLPGNS